MKLKTIMQDRPDLIESELSGLAFDSLQQIFKTVHLDVMFSQECPENFLNDDVHLVIDPAAGGPHSDYAIVSVHRNKGLITVCIAYYSIQDCIDLLVESAFQIASSHTVYENVL